MAVVLLFWDSNMAAVTSCEYTLLLLLLGTLSKDVFEARTSTGSEAFSLFICLDANKLVLLSLFSLLKTIYPRVSTKWFPRDAKSPLPVDVRRSKTLLLKLPTFSSPSPSSLLKFPIVFCTPMWSTWRHVKPFYILCWRRCWFYFYYFSHLRCIVVKHSWWSGEITGRIGVHAAFTSSGSRRNRRDHGENQSWLGKIHLI